MGQIAFKGSGAGAATETSGAACSPASPATVDAGDILIIHAYFEGTATAPNLPAGFTLLHGPVTVESTIGRHWIAGKIADGSEDGAANALGTQAVTTMRSGRCYSFSGRVSGSITDLVKGFASTTHATDPQMPSVTTTHAQSRAIACVVQNDNNSLAAATGETGGDWTEAVAEFVSALTPGLVLQLQTATITSPPGTISGGSVAATNDPSGVIGFEIAPELPAITGTVSVTTASTTGTASGKVTVTGAASATAANTTSSASGKVTVTGVIAATLENTTGAATGNVGNPSISGTVSVTTAPTTAAASGKVSVTGAAAATAANTTSAAAGKVASVGSIAAALQDAIAAASGKVTVTGAIAATLANTTGAASGAVGNPAITGTVSVTTAATTGAASGKVAVTGTAAPATQDSTAAAAGKVASVGSIAASTANTTASASGTVSDPLALIEDPDYIVSALARDFTARAVRRTFIVIAGGRDYSAAARARSYTVAATGRKWEVAA